MTGSRVAVAAGGTSIEREVSLRGARRVVAALRAGGADVSELEIDHTILDRVRELAPDYVFIVAHGRNGEDGALQELLELIDVPFTGSGSLASALCIDKVLFKELMAAAGTIPQVDYVDVHEQQLSGSHRRELLEQVTARFCSQLGEEVAPG